MYRAELAKAKASGFRPSRYEKEFARELGISAERFMEIQIRREVQEAYGRGMTVAALQEEERLQRLKAEQAERVRLREEAIQASRFLDGVRSAPPKVKLPPAGNSGLPGSEGFNGLPPQKTATPCKRLPNSEAACVRPM